MKRIITFFLFLAMAIGGVRAQKGMQQIGVSSSLLKEKGRTGEIGAGINYLYNLTDNIGIESAGFYYFPQNTTRDDWLISLCGIYYLGIPKVCRPYGKVGLSIPNIHERIKVVPLAGIGLNVRLSYHLSFKPEIQSIMTDNDLTIVMNLGFTYNF